MFDELIEKLDVTIKKIRGTGKITEKNIAEAMREIRRVLLEADVNYQVVKSFVSSIQEKAVGQEIVKSVTPGQQVVKIVRGAGVYPPLLWWLGFRDQERQHLLQNWGYISGSKAKSQ